MPTQQFKIQDEYGIAVQNAVISVIVNQEVIFSGLTNSLGIASATIDTSFDNLVYIRFQSYTPVSFVYRGIGGESTITIEIHTCQPLQQDILDEGRFLVWQPVIYCVRQQTLPLEVCNENQAGQNILCDRFETQETEDYYPLPVKNSDVIKWVMNSSEVLYNDDLVENLQIGITQKGVLVAENIGTITEFGDQLFCEVTIPCLIDCQYEFVIYRKDVIDYIGVIITPPTTPEACDGTIQAVVALGTAPYEYSLDGVTWQSSDTFTGLCAQQYTVYVRDSDCSQGIKPAYLLPINCGDFQGFTLQQVIDLGITLGQVLACTLCDFVPEGDVQYDTENIVLNGDFSYGGTNWLHPDGSPSFTGGYALLNSNTEYIYQSIPTLNAGDGIRFKATIFDVTGTFRIQSNNGGMIYSGSVDIDLEITLSNFTVNDGSSNLIIEPLGSTQLKITNIEFYRILNCE